MLPVPFDIRILVEKKIWRPGPQSPKNYIDSVDKSVDKWFFQNIINRANPWYAGGQR